MRQLATFDSVTSGENIGTSTARLISLILYNLGPKFTERCHPSGAGSSHISYHNQDDTHRPTWSRQPPSEALFKVIDSILCQVDR